MPLNEAERLRALWRLDVLDSPPERELDGLAKAAALVCEVPISLISLVDSERQWFKANVGLEGVSETHRALAFCAYTILSSGIFEVPDARADVRFAGNPLVTGDPNIRFYAGATLSVGDGAHIGTLCVIDRIPRILSPVQREILAQLALTASSVLEHRRYRQGWAANEARLRAVTDSAPDAIISIDQQQRIVVFNLAAERMLRCPASEALGQPLGRFIPERFRDAHERHVESFAGDDVVTRPMYTARRLWGLRRDGTEFPVEASISRARVDGRLLSTVILRDITERAKLELRELARSGELRAANSALQRTRDQLAVAQRITHVGSWELEVDSGIVSWSDELFRIVGLTPADSVPPLPERRSLFALESWERITNAMAHSLQTGEPYELNLTVLRASGERRSTVARAEAVRGESGRVERFVGTLRDTTDQERVARQLQKTERLQSAILSHAGLSIIAADMHGTITLFNRAAEQLLGYTTSEVIGRATPSLFHDPAEVEARRAVLERELGVALNPFEVFVVKSRTGKAEAGEWTYVRKDGSRVPVLLTVSALRDESELIVGYLGVGVDLTDRKAQEQELIKLNRLLAERSAQAESANKAKSEFLANMSHEIRTPMNGVLGMLHLVLDSTPSGEQREYLSAAHASAEALLDIINDILDLSKIEAGKFSLDDVGLSVYELLRSSLQAVCLRAQARSIALLVDVSPAVPRMLQGDPVRLRQVLINLLSNAVKFTERGHVLLSLELGSDAELGKPCLIVCVSDTGIGISADRLEHVFESFQQADGSITRRYGGTGLGLTICKQLITRMGGRIWIESKEGVGSHFRFAVPLRATPSADAVHEPALEFPVGPFHFKDLRDAQGRASDPSAGSCPGASAERPEQVRTSPALEVLVVEDHPVNAHFLGALLARSGHTVVHAWNGARALAILEERTFDLVLMDVQMPELDGLEVTRRIRERERATGRHLPIVALTANAMKGDEGDCFEAGMDYYLPKPLSPESLQRILARIALGRASVPMAAPDVSKVVPRSAQTALARAELLLRTAGDREFMAQLLQVFRSSEAEMMRDVESSVAEGNCAKVRAAAHRLKGALQLICAGPASEVARSIEEDARQSDGQRLSFHLAHLHEEMQHLRTALSDDP